MEYIDIIRNAKNILFRAFWITILFVIVFWGFVMADIMQYFMWALPGFTLESANQYVMWMVGIIEIAGIVLFLIPALALCWEIRREIRAMEDWENNKEKFFEQLNEDMKREFGCKAAAALPAKPAKAKSKSKPKSKSKK